MKTQISYSNINQILSKKLGLRILGIILLSLFSFATFASQTPTCSIKKQNGSSCYWTTLKSVTHNNNGTYTITILVEAGNASGSNGCHALSHFAIQANDNTFSNPSWQRVTGTVTFTGFEMSLGGGNSQSFDNGFKLINPHNFGDTHAGSFTVTYTLTSLQDEKFAAKAGNDSNDASFTIADFNQVLNCNTLLPVAIDDENTINYFASGSVVEAIPSVLSNDLYNGVAIIPSQVTLTQVTAPSNSGIVFTPSTGRVTVAPGTPGGTYTFSYKVSMNSAPANSDVATVTIKILQANLGITKTVNPTTVVAGQNMRYTLTVTNYGPTEANDVRVSDVLSTDLTSVTTVASVGSWSASIWSIGTLASGASANLDINANVLATASGTIVNSATVSSTTPDINMGNNTANANLIVTALSGPSAKPDVSTVNINSSVTNSVWSNDTKGSGDIVASSVALVSGTQTNATLGTFTVNPTTGDITFTAGSNTGTSAITYRITDTNGLSSTSTFTVTITKANLTIAKTATLTVENGVQKITYLITVTNNGTAAASSVIVTDNLPTGVTYVSSAPSTGTAWTAPTWTIGALAASGGAATLSIVTTVNSNFTGTSITNNASVQSTTTTPVSTSVTTSVTVITGPTAVNDATTTSMNTQVDLNVLANDTYVSSPIDVTTVAFVSGTQSPTTSGTFSINSETGLVTFVPTTGYTGTTTIGYKVKDVNGLFSNQATISITVTSSLVNNFPSSGFSTVAFEDLWPFKGDYDMNDLVMDYKFVITSNSNNYVDKVVGTFKIKAFGASFENGFGFQFPNVPPASITSVSGYDLQEGFIILNSNGTESGQTKPTIIVYDNAFKEMTSPGGIGVNTDPTQAYVTPKTLTITINFAPNTCLLSNLNIGNFNPFIFVNKVRGVEVHLPDYAPTSKANLSLFGTGDDNSIPAQGKYYKTANNLPWAINTYEQFDYPKEKVDISQAFIHFAAWATSGGTSFTDWYKDFSGFRNSGLIYPIHH